MSLCRYFFVLVAAALAWSAAQAQQTPAAHPGSQAEVVSEPRFGVRRPPPPPCGLPAAPAGARIVLLNGYRAPGLSSVAVGPPDRETRASSVTIEPGDEKLYLVLTAEGPMIWQFDGALDRVVKAVLLSKWGAVGDAPVDIGATGLPPDALAFSGASTCSMMLADIFGRAQPGSNEARRNAAVARFKGLVGREPDSVVEVNQIWRLRLPSGDVEPAKEPATDVSSYSHVVVGNITYGLPPRSHVVLGPTEAGGKWTRIESPAASAVDELRAHFLRDFPGGVVRIDPGTVVSPAPVATYEVLPGEAGLVQLLEQGAIERNRKGEYLVKRKIHYPPHIDAKFLVLKGVPVPDGLAGRSVVASEDTGDLVNRPTPATVPSQLRDTECVMPQVPAGATLVLVGTGGATALSTAAVGSQDAVTSTAQVTIEDGAEPLHVVLVSSAPLIWQFDGAVERVASAYLISNHAAYPKPLPGIASGARGLPRDVVTFAARPDCIKWFNDKPTIDATVAAGAVQRRAAHEPDAVVALDRAEHVWLPSGHHERSGDEPPRDDVKVMWIERTSAPITVASLRAEFARAYPAGIGRIDPATVIAGQPVEAYAVLPGRAGLLQLMEQGKLAPGKGQEFIVRDKIRYPGALDNDYRFRIPVGIALPDGNPGQACVIADSGDPPPTRACR